MIAVTIQAGTLESPIKVTRQDMLKIGSKALQTLTERVALARGVDDAVMRPLSKPHAKKKKNIGQRPERNMMFTGSMLGSLQVVESDEKRVSVGFTRQSERQKASYNQAREPWFGLSRNDTRTMKSFIERLLTRQK